jgi:hypothetical protein
MTSIHGPAGLARHESAARPADTAAMDDIQALLASPRRPPGEEALEEIAEIVARTGRALVALRDFTVECDDDERGLPYVAVRSDGITVRVGQDPRLGKRPYRHLHRHPPRSAPRPLSREDRGALGYEGFYHRHCRSLTACGCCAPQAVA